jgi:hypothetical protein
VGSNVLVAASEHHFSPQGRIYRRSIEGDGPLKVGGGLPDWTDGIVDTHCIAASGPRAALADRGGSVYVSGDACKSWSRLAQSIPSPSSVLLLSPESNS